MAPHSLCTAFTAIFVSRLFQSAGDLHRIASTKDLVIEDSKSQSSFDCDQSQVVSGASRAVSSFSRLASKVNSRLGFVAIDRLRTFRTTLVFLSLSAAV